MPEFIQFGKATHIRADHIVSVQEEADGSLIVGLQGGGTLHVKADDEAVEKVRGMAGIQPQKKEAEERKMQPAPQGHARREERK